MRRTLIGSVAAMTASEPPRSRLKKPFSSMQAALHSFRSKVIESKEKPGETEVAFENDGDFKKGYESAITGYSPLMPLDDLLYNQKATNKPSSISYHETQSTCETEQSKKPTMLLDLPPEILEMILLMLTPDSFSVMLMSSKAIREIILSTPRILRHQLLKVPGLRLPDSAKTGDLLKTFNKRAAAGAWNGIESFADIITHTVSLPGFVQGPWTRPKFNWIQPCCTSDKSCDRGLLATASDSRGIVHVYQIRKGRITPLHKLDPRTLELEGSDDTHIKWQCAATRWQRSNTTSHLEHLVALFSYTIQPCDPKIKGPFAQQFITDAVVKAEKTYHLASWKLHKDASKPYMTCDVLCPPEYKPIMLATKEDDNKQNPCVPIAIIFEHTLAKSLMYKISIYQVSHAKTVHLPVKPIEVEGVEPSGLSFSQRLMRARITNGIHPELLLYGWDTAPLDNVTSLATPGLSQLRLSTSVSTASRTPKLFTSKASPRAFKGIAIKSRHAHECGVYQNGSKYCIQTILELVVPRSIKCKGAYLVKYAEEQETCSPYDLNHDLPSLEYTVVAKLIESESQMSSPMGHIIAVSRDKEWVAMAEWDRIKLYGLHAEAFLDPSRGSLPLNEPPLAQWTKQNRPISREIAIHDDKAYTTSPGQGYFHDHIRIRGKEGKRIVGIRPIELPSRGVVYSMAFAKKNILWAWTDRGLVKWAWNKKWSGLREDIPLSMLPENVWSYG